MAFDLIHSHFTQILEKPVAAGETIGVEGLMVASILEAGVEKLKLPSAATDILLGFAITDTHNYATQPVVEQLVVPAVAPYTITLAHIPSGASVIRIYSSVLAADLTLGNPANATEYSRLNNVVTVNAARAGETLTVYYRYNLTVIEAQQQFYQRNINRYASQFYGQIAYGCDQGEIFLDTFDTSKDYSTFAPGSGLIVDFTTNKGYVTVGTLAGALAFPGHVIKLPTVADPRLGLAYQIVK